MADVSAATRQGPITDGERAPRIAIACGGTGGHVSPALAVADAWRELQPGVELFFLGTSGPFERRLPSDRLSVVRAAPFSGADARAKLAAVVTTVAGMLDARHVLRRERIDLLLGLGNYATVPTVLAAWTLGVPVVIHEANAVPGLANRILGSLASAILLGFESSRGAFAHRGTVTGVPVRAEIAALAARTRTAPAPDRRVRILVAGGSGGSAFLNEHAPELCSAVAARGWDVRVRHLAGERDVARTEARYGASGVAASVVGYADDMAAEYAGADFGVVCAGAVTLAEVGAAGLPVLAVPLARAAHDHQSANARAFAAVTRARWVREDGWDADALAGHVASVIGSTDASRAASAGVRRFARIDAAASVVRACMEVLTSTPARGERVRRSRMDRS